jgi:hypothetical protein
MYDVQETNPKTYRMAGLLAIMAGILVLPLGVLLLPVSLIMLGMILLRMANPPAQIDFV